MRNVVTISALLLACASASAGFASNRETARLAAPQQKDSAAGAVPKKGDTITVKGCLAGAALQATDVTSAAEAPVALAAGLTFRLTGDKKLLKQLRDDHNGKLVSIAGVLRSDLPRESTETRQLGRMRVTIGAVPSPMSPEAEARRSLPVLEMKSFDGTTTPCGR